MGKKLQPLAESTDSYKQPETEPKDRRFGGQAITTYLAGNVIEEKKQNKSCKSNLHIYCHHQL